MDNLDHDGRLERSVDRHYDDAGYEKASEEVDEKLNDLLLEDVEASDDFLCFLLDPKRAKTMTLDEYINVWLKTDFGAKWYEQMVEAVIRENDETGEEQDD